MMKCYGDFVCGKCCTISHKSFEVEKEEDCYNLSITCPTCGKEVQLITPSDMKVIVRNLSNKGYHITNIIGKTLGISFYPKVPKEVLEPLSDRLGEFAYDVSEEHEDILVNDRLRMGAVDEADLKEYRANAVREIMGFVRQLPQVGMGLERNLDVPDRVEMNDDVNDDGFAENLVASTPVEEEQSDDTNGSV